MRKTKIICTLGPASESPEIIKALVEAGMNVARFNMSHGSHEDHARRMSTVRSVAKSLNVSVGILLDTKGPEVRVKSFKGGKVQIKDGQAFTFTGDEVEGDNTKVSVTYKQLYEDMKKGDKIMVNDGLVKFEVVDVKGHDVLCKCLQGGFISNSKSMNFPNKVLSMPFISDVDREDIIFGAKQQVDFIAASFVSNKMNVVELRQLLNHHGGNDIEIIAKIENQSGVNNIEDIYTVADGCMVARGDMGVEIEFARLPIIQRRIVKIARNLGKRVIVATEMLESMIEHPRPTRAETSDVATAVSQGVSAVMLSGETAAGKYPVECVKAMSEIALEAENQISYFSELTHNVFKIDNMAEAVCHAAVDAALALNVRMIIVFTKSGRSAKNVSRFRPGMPIVAATSDELTFPRLSLCWGTIPNLVQDYHKSEDLYKQAEDIARNNGCVDGDTVVVTSGLPLNQGTNIMKIMTLQPKILEQKE
ncbi:pyruvate kinase [Tritrichomonas foetus]|uniref:Pyruvate kinase n=1 Tax=Tritrichomonas foetus TaxID=1144522 RepID=A0A1J4JBU8_9EUKA|nr:pyruvate kinase [Tritrichomonas foetus]|eukprot:OHS94732.1 pyruvate kinase [Tritrichomonas foetus]